MVSCVLNSELKTGNADSVREVETPAKQEAYRVFSSFFKNVAENNVTQEILDDVNTAFNGTFNKQLIRFLKESISVLYHNYDEFEENSYFYKELNLRYNNTTVNLAEYDTFRRTIKELAIPRCSIIDHMVMLLDKLQSYPIKATEQQQLFMYCHIYLVIAIKCVNITDSTFELFNNLEKTSLNHMLVIMLLSKLDASGFDLLTLKKHQSLNSVCSNYDHVKTKIIEKIDQYLNQAKSKKKPVDINSFSVALVNFFVKKINDVLLVTFDDIYKNKLINITFVYLYKHRKDIEAYKISAPVKAKMWTRLMQVYIIFLRTIYFKVTVDKK